MRAMKPQPVYVEIRFRGDLAEIWNRTQTPEEHNRWDIRFTEIEYRGTFDVEWRPCDSGVVPQHVKPFREERRE